MGNQSEANAPAVERRYLNKKEAAAMLGITPRCLTTWMRTRGIPFYRIDRIVRFDPLHIREYLDANFKYDKAAAR